MLKQTVIVFILAVFAYWIFTVIVQLGIFRPVYNHSPGKCVHLKGIVHGSEDIQVLPNGIAFISSGFDLNTNQKHEGVVGKIFQFDFNHPDESPVEMKIVGNEKYEAYIPHGIFLWTNPKTGTSYLYLVNHTPIGEVVDKYRIDSNKKSLEHVRRIENEPNMYNVNDLVVLDEDRFYYSNYKYYGVDTDLALNLHWSSVGFYDGKTAVLVDTGLLIANGIALSKDQKTLYVAHFGREEIRVYQRNADNSLTYRKSIPVRGTLPDNIDVDPKTGDLWIGCHPSLIELLKHLHDRKGHVSPSQVLRIRNPDSSSPEVIEVYSNDGKELSASTVAARYGNSMLIGSVLDRALYCQLSCA